MEDNYWHRLQAPWSTGAMATTEETRSVWWPDFRSRNHQRGSIYRVYSNRLVSSTRGYIEQAGMTTMRGNHW